MFRLVRSRWLWTFTLLSYFTGLYGDLIHRLKELSGTVGGKQKMLSVHSGFDACDDLQYFRLHRTLYRLSQHSAQERSFHKTSVDTKIEPQCFIFLQGLIYRYQLTTINQHGTYTASQSCRRSGPLRVRWHTTWAVSTAIPGPTSCDGPIKPTPSHSLGPHHETRTVHI